MESTVGFLFLSLSLSLPVSEIRLRNDLYCVEWGVKLYSLTHPVSEIGHAFTGLIEAVD